MHHGVKYYRNSQRDTAVLRKEITIVLHSYAIHMENHVAIILQESHICIQYVCNKLK